MDTKTKKHPLALSLAIDVANTHQVPVWLRCGRDTLTWHIDFVPASWSPAQLQEKRAHGYIIDANH